MVDLVTPKLGLVKPEVGASRDSWGGKLNSNWDKVDNLLQEAPNDGLQYVRKNLGWVISAPDWGVITGKPSTFPPSTHTHAQADVTNLVSDLAGKEPLIAAGTVAQYRRGDKTWQTLDKAAVGLSNVDNTSDANKPVSTAQSAADALRVLKSGDTMTGNLTIGPAANTHATMTVQSSGTGQSQLLLRSDEVPFIRLDKGAGKVAYLEGRAWHGPSSAYKVRWQIMLGDTAAELGSNSGSEFALYCSNDDTTAYIKALRGQRNTGLLSVFGNPTDALGIATKQYVDANVLPPGMLGYFPAGSAPAGWLKLNGALVSRTTYANLWAYAQTAAIVADATWTGSTLEQGKFSQGDGSTTFRLPDLRADFVRGVDDGRGVDTGRVVGTRQGATVGTHGHTADALPAHDHTSAAMAAHYHTSATSTAYSSGNPAINQSNVGTNAQATGTATKYVEGTSAGTPTINVASAGTPSINNSTTAENKPVNAAWLACIKY